MTPEIQTGAAHHVALTVTDVDRSREFYTSLLGFQVLKEVGSIVLLSNGSMILALAPPRDPNRVLSDDRFNENRVGLGHLCFSVVSRDEIERAVRLFDERGVPHGEIQDLAESRFYALTFQDPDNIKLELIAPYS